MPKVAEVIVDVPTLQTNNPYEFLIPEHLQRDIKVGMRVIVPFGQGNRRILGFITKLKKEQIFQGELKDISSVMDLEPVLNEELIDLGEWMADTTYSFRISCYQTMLPAVLRASYKKIVKLSDNIQEETLFDIFRGKNWMSWEEVEERGLESTMLRLKSEDKVLVNYLVDDKVTKKTKRIVKANLSPDRLEAELEDVAKNAHRQIDFIQLLMQLAEDESIDMKVLREDYGVTSAVVNRGVEKQWCRIEEVELYRDPYQDSNIAPTESLELNIVLIVLIIASFLQTSTFIYISLELKSHHVSLL